MLALCYLIIIFIQKSGSLKRRMGGKTGMDVRGLIRAKGSRQDILRVKGDRRIIVDLACPPLLCFRHFKYGIPKGG